MSYQDAVIRDNPVGFWILDAPNLSDDYSFGNMVAGVRTFNNATIGAGAIYSDILPICTGGTNSVRINSTSTSKITITNNYEIFYKNTENKEFLIEFWIAFTDIPTSTTVMSIGSNISLNFSQNVAKLTLQDYAGKKYYARLNIDTYQSQMHVIVKYSSRNMSFEINGQESSKIFLDTSSYFYETASHNIVFGPATSSDYFVIDCIAFYNYILRTDQIIDHVKWSILDKSPEAYTIANSGGTYSPKVDDGNISQKFLFNRKRTWESGKYSSSIIVAGNSLMMRQIPALTMYNPTETAGTESFSTGFSTTNGDSAILNNFSTLYNPQNHTIACQVYVTSEASEKPYFSISGFNFGTLALVKPTSSLSLKLTSSGDAAITAQVSSLTNNTWYDVKIVFNGDQITLTVGSATPVSNTLTNGVASISNSILYVGNYYKDSSGSITSYSASGIIKNFSIFEDDDSRLSDLNNTGLVTAKLTSSLDVSQYGEWLALVPINSGTNISATKLYHDSSSKNVYVYGSTDGNTWTVQSSSGDQAPGLTINSNGTAYHLKVTMEAVESYYNIPIVSHMELFIYNTLNAFSHGKTFSIKEYSDPSTSHTHNLKSRDFNLFARDKNIGIGFHKPSSPSTQKSGMSIGSSPDSYQTVEFWFKVNENAGAAKNFLFDIASNVAELTHNASLVLNYSGAWSSVFINGQAYTTGTKTLLVGEMYHFVGVLTSSTTSNFYFNAKNDYSTGHSYSTYGDITIYSDTKNAAFALKKYNMKLGMNKQVVSDINYLLQNDSVVADISNWIIYSSAN